MFCGSPEGAFGFRLCAKLTACTCQRSVRETNTARVIRTQGIHPNVVNVREELRNVRSVVCADYWFRLAPLIH